MSRGAVAVDMTTETTAVEAVATATSMRPAAEVVVFPPPKARLNARHGNRGCPIQAGSLVTFRMRRALSL